MGNPFSHQNEVAWNEAERLRELKPHPPEVMLVGNKAPPIFYWVCGRCGRGEHTTVRRAPVCAGGLSCDLDERGDVEG